jgi:hypothetical protein
MIEHDSIALDVEAWADYWASLKVDAVLVSVTGILAFYQTNVPFQRKGEYWATGVFSVTAARPPRNVGSRPNGAGRIVIDFGATRE